MYEVGNFPVLLKKILTLEILSNDHLTTSYTISIMNVSVLFCHVESYR